MVRSARAHDDVRVDHVGCRARSEQSSDVCGIDAVEGNNVGGRLSDQPGLAHVPFRMAHRLSERGRRDRDASTDFAGTGQERHNPPVVAVEGDQPSSVHGDTRHQAADISRRPFLPQFRSSSVRGPLSRGAPQPAGRPTRQCRRAPRQRRAARTPEMVGVVPDSTRARIRLPSPSSSVTVIFLVAIPLTIPSRLCSRISRPEPGALRSVRQGWQGRGGDRLG